MEQDLAQVKQESLGTDSVLVTLDSRLQEFSKEVKAMRETYNENHISLENLYKANAESKRNIEAVSQNVDTKLASERVRSDSVFTTFSEASQSQIVNLQAEQAGIRESIGSLNSSIQNTQFQVDSILASIDPEKLSVMEENLLNLQSTVTLLDSSFSDFQLSVADHMMGSEDQLQTLEKHARVQDSANYDILSQLVLLENKIISLTNSFNELMAMPGATANITPAPVQQTPVYQTQQPLATGTKMDYETYKQHYIDALSSYQNGDYMGAIDDFQLLLQNDSQNDLADNAQYWIGECYYAMDDYGQAITAFRKVLNFADSNKADAAQFKIGYSYLNSGDKTRGYNELERLLDMFPESTYRDKIKHILASR
ncbi:MAG: tetratricopeptide repeat protein [Candidatus Marinimicrobia bacterium]|nr:tetratricopeptide repeat protein [Candidatus Neomarinimicrobiota bacterium]